MAYGIIYNVDKLQYAPDRLVIDGQVVDQPTHELYLSLGYRECEFTDCPECTATEFYIDSWIYRNDKCFQTWVKVERPVDWQINDLKNELATYDYIGVKIAMGVATREEYADEIAYTETLRVKIRELQARQA